MKFRVVFARVQTVTGGHREMVAMVTSNDWDEGEEKEANYRVILKKIYVICEGKCGLIVIFFFFFTIYAEKVTDVHFSGH